MTCRPLPLLVALLSLAPVAGCVTWQKVPLTNGEFPRNTIRVGDELRAETRSGEEVSLDVAGVEGTTITGEQGERIQAGDLASLEVGRVSKKTMIITLSVVGGILGTAWLVDELDDCSYSDGDVFCAE
jgi:hypothetical protein